MLLIFVSVTEILLFEKGFRTTVVDTELGWISERERASALGVRALILVGASRIQLGIDLNVLRRMTGLEPVQLAIDGSSFVPVFEGLARDPTIRGTIILALMPGPVSFKTSSVGGSQRYQSDYDALSSEGFHWPNYRDSEVWFASIIRNWLINYADGGRPLDSLFNRLANARATPQYLLTYPDRSRQADYQRVPMPEFYLNRVFRHIGNPVEVDINRPADQLAKQLADYIRRLKPTRGSAQTDEGLEHLEHAVSAIQSRGGRVIIIAMPTSGLILEADSRRFPRTLYWDKVVATTTAKTTHWQDHNALSGFVCPDGSHLDKRDTVSFTEALVIAAGLSRP